MGTKERIEQMVGSSKVFLFMKGTPEEPQCGFSMKAAEILKDLDVDFKSFDVLTDESIRQGIKAYSDWPTIPQLYVDGKFVGGCDIMVQMQESGELQRLIKGSD